MLRSKKEWFGSWLLMFTFIAAFFLVLLLPLGALGLTDEEVILQNALEDGQIIRLHILAEDDSQRAQEIKLAVRDAVLAEFGEVLAAAGAQNADMVFACLTEYQEEMREVAERTASQYGFHGPVTVQVGVMSLPEKAYGGVNLPEGEYRALRITLGCGQGQNWWCILFPQLCLALASEEPWQMDAEHLRIQPGIRWQSEEIFRHWLIVPVAAPKLPISGEP